MLTVSAARAAVRKKYDAGFARWAVAQAVAPPGTETVPQPPPGPHLDLPLHPPTERTAFDQETFDWNDGWRRADVPYLIRVRRQWASAGTQDIPDRLRFPTPADVAVFAGRTAHWRLVSTRIAALVQEWGAHEAMTAAVRRHAATLTELSAADSTRLDGVLRWLAEHPDSGMYIRQLPIRGVDTKWVSAHQGLVTALFKAITGRESLGLATSPKLVRMRVLDPALLPITITDFSAPVTELAGLDLTPQTVIVCENLETVLAMEALAGTVVVHGSGYAVGVLGDIPWIRRARIVYWGDLDSHGFLILHQIRSHCPDVRSVLMDTTTLETYRDLWVPEPKPSPATMTLLTPSEQATLEALRAHGNVRMEQERIEWSAAMAALRAATGT